MHPIILPLSGKKRLVREWNRGRRMGAMKGGLTVRAISVYVEVGKSYIMTFGCTKILFFNSQHQDNHTPTVFPTPGLYSPLSCQPTLEP